MFETDEHRDAIVRHIELLQHYYRRREVYVSGGLALYYEPGNRKKLVVPDTFVVKRVPPLIRRNYEIWTEGKPPDVVIETTSRKTRSKDIGPKPALYAQLGIKEYYLFDALQEYMDPPVQGYTLTSDGYRRIPLDAKGFLVSQELGLLLGLADAQLQFYRGDTGERLLTAAEREEIEQQAGQREAEARRAAEAEVMCLRTELARLQSQSSP